MRLLTLALTIAFASSAQAQTVAPPETTTDAGPKIYTVEPGFSIDHLNTSKEVETMAHPLVQTVYDEETYYQRDTRLKRERREATKMEIAYQTLNMVDAVQTVECVQRGACEEGNPLLRLVIGKRPSPLAVFGVKALFGLGHWVLFTHLRRTDPQGAKNMARWSVIMQGGVVAINARMAF